jgi:N-acetylmuramic acid 6-phosphate etherase
MTRLPDLSTLQTEGSNPHSARIDQTSTIELCSIINREDSTVAAAVGDPRCLSVIAAAIDNLTDRVRRGGRVIYVGAGTSGR